MNAIPAKIAPAWWPAAEAEIHAIAGGYVERIRDKLTENPKGIVEKKNPFLFRMRAIEGPRALASMMIDAFLSSSEETVFGGILQSVALSVCKHAKHGRPSSTESIDMEYDQNGIRTLIQVKSGANWGNSSQRKKLAQSFQTARQVLRQSDSKLQVRMVEGCCYGRTRKRHLPTHEQLVGEAFWRDISDWDGVPVALMRLLGQHASNGMREARNDATDRMVQYLSDQGVIQGDEILWERLMFLVFRKQPCRPGT